MCGFYLEPVAQAAYDEFFTPASEFYHRLLETIRIMFPTIRDPSKELRIAELRIAE